jgi:hypothetical protein
MSICTILLFGSLFDPFGRHPPELLLGVTTLGPIKEFS